MPKQCSTKIINHSGKAMKIIVITGDKEVPYTMSKCHSIDFSNKDMTGSVIMFPKDIKLRIVRKIEKTGCFSSRLVDKKETIQQASRYEIPTQCVSIKIKKVVSISKEESDDEDENPEGKIEG